MGRLAWSQVRFRPARALALIAGVLVAATAFTVLTAASRTAQARTVGKVSANFSPAYDILVRPKGARSAVESTTGTVEPDFLSGIYGGITLQQLTAPPAMPDMDAAWADAQASAAGHTVATVSTTAQQVYTAVLKNPPMVQVELGPYSPIDADTATGTPVAGYWSVGPVHYRRTTGGALAVRQVTNPAWATWYTGDSYPVSMDNEESQYRTVTSHQQPPKSIASNLEPSTLSLIKIAGVFDPARMKVFSALSEVPLGDYQPVAASPANAASRRALHGGDLLPNQNIGGLVSQPVNLITTLSALPQLEHGRQFTGVPAADPISVIRVRVAGG